VVQWKPLNVITDKVSYWFSEGEGQVRLALASLKKSFLAFGSTTKKCILHLKQVQLKDAKFVYKSLQVVSNHIF
jgi:hypothetical protein